MARKKVQDISFSWREGRYFDMWMIVHVAAGAVAALIALLSGAPRLLVYAVALVVLVMWEAFELLLKVREEQENRVLDVIFGLIGFGLMYESMLNVDPLAYPSTLTVTIVFFLMLSFIGWLDGKHREENDK